MFPTKAGATSAWRREGGLRCSMGPSTRVDEWNKDGTLRTATALVMQRSCFVVLENRIALQYVTLFHEQPDWRKCSNVVILQHLCHFYSSRLLRKLFWNKSDSGIKQNNSNKIKSLLFPSRLLTDGYTGRTVVAKGHSWRSVCLFLYAGRCSHFWSRLRTSALHRPYWSGKLELSGKKWLWGRYPLEKTNVHWKFLLSSCGLVLAVPVLLKGRGSDEYKSIWSK